MSMALSTKTSLLVRRLTPYKTIACIVPTSTNYSQSKSSTHTTTYKTTPTSRTTTSKLPGVAASDPYLSVANPLRTTHTPRVTNHELSRLLHDAKVGLLLVAQPLGRRNERATPGDRRRRDALAGALRRQLGSAVAVGVVDSSLTRAEVLSKERENPWMWEAVGISTVPRYLPPPLHIQAAAQLQVVLEEESGGWPNTFG